MSSPIAPVGSISPIPVPSRILPTEGAQPGAFQALLNQSLSTVEQARASANASVDRFLSGEGEELHRVAIATQQAELSFELFAQVRNKVVQAYQDIMRMQI
jgi:flagellar hook-basal body complex protein FliE